MDADHVCFCTICFNCNANKVRIKLKCIKSTASTRALFPSFYKNNPETLLKHCTWLPCIIMVHPLTEPATSLCTQLPSFYRMHNFFFCNAQLGTRAHECKFRSALQLSLSLSNGHRRGAKFRVTGQSLQPCSRAACSMQPPEQACCQRRVLSEPLPRKPRSSSSSTIPLSFTVMPLTDKSVQQDEYSQKARNKAAAPCGCHLNTAPKIK